MSVMNDLKNKLERAGKLTPSETEAVAGCNERQVDNKVAYTLRSRQHAAAEDGA